MTTYHGTLTLTFPDGQEKRVTLSKRAVTLGRSTTSDVIVPDSQVSRRHLRLLLDDKGCLLVDLKSANGTFVNGQRVHEAPLGADDVVTLGGCTLRYNPSAPPADDPLDRKHLPMHLSDTDTPRLAIHSQGKTWEIPLTDEAMLIGRDDRAAIHIPDKHLDKQHARVERRGGDFYVSDLGSKEGTWIGLERIEGRRKLRDGEMIRVADTLLAFKQGQSSEEATLVHRAVGDIVRRGLRPVVVIPGFMGSDLWRGDERIWPELSTLLAEPERLAMQPGETPNLEARALVNDVVIVPGLLEFEQYGRLGDYLEEELGYERGKNLLEFAYDWRLDNRLTARKLAETIDAWQVRKPVVLIAHSMGCLSARYYIEKLGGKEVVERLILIGSPNQGAPLAPLGLVAGLDLIPFSTYDERLVRMLRTLPSLYQMIPTYHFAVDQDDHPIDLFKDEAWLDAASLPYLRDARKFYREIGKAASVPAVSIFGYGIKTVFKMRVQREADGRWKGVDFIADEVGDNCVPQTSAILKDSLIHPVWQHHGALYVDNEVQTRLRLELMR